MLEHDLQNSLATSDDDAEYEEDYDIAPETLDASDAHAANNQLQNGLLEEQSDGEGEAEEHEVGEVNDEMQLEEHAESEDDDMPDPDDAPLEDTDEDTGEDSNEEDEEEEEEYEDAEGVGAVKIQPGALETDDDVASGSGGADSSASVDEDEDDDSRDSTDAEVEAQWQSAAEEDEEEEPANPNRCMYVASLHFLSSTNKLSDSVNKTKRMTQVKYLSFT